MQAASEEAGRQGFAAVVVAPSPDLVYLTGYDPMPLERATLLVLQPGRDSFLVVPELERPLAALAPAGGEVDLRGWIDGADPYRMVVDPLPQEGRVAVSDRTWAAHVLALQGTAPGFTWSSASPVLGKLRAIKDADELDALRRAGAAADRAFVDVVRLPFAGRREDEVAADLARLLREHGHSSVDFTIVAGGPNGASPHHEPGARVVLPGDVVVMDFGGVLDGYCSDTTRTVVVGDPTPEQREVHGVVEAAQRAARRAVRPGHALQEVDRAAREVIAAAGYGERFIHRTGHGIGIEVHEPPYVIEGNETPMEPGMTFSVEPGIYLPGAFGVRIEDIVAVTADGVETLNDSPRGLSIVG